MERKLNLNFGLASEDVEIRESLSDIHESRELVLPMRS